MESVERALAQLWETVATAITGPGAVVVVSGEAGVGKSSLLRRFAGGLDDGVRVLAGACDDLLTARPLGALRDAAAGTGGPLERALNSCDGVFDAAIAELSGPVPSVLLVDDVHWADDATLDVLGYLARRVERLAAVIVVTIRDSQPAPGLGRWLGTLGPVRRVYCSRGRWRRSPR